MCVTTRLFVTASTESPFRSKFVTEVGYIYTTDWTLKITIRFPVGGKRFHFFEASREVVLHRLLPFSGSEVAAASIWPLAPLQQRRQNCKYVRQDFHPPCAFSGWHGDGLTFTLIIFVHLICYIALLLDASWKPNGRVTFVTKPTKQ